jgi:hypothetical protein
MFSIWKRRKKTMRRENERKRNGENDGRKGRKTTGMDKERNKVGKHVKERNLRLFSCFL